MDKRLGVPMLRVSCFVSGQSRKTTDHHNTRWSQANGTEANCFDADTQACRHSSSCRPSSMPTPKLMQTLKHADIQACRHSSMQTLKLRSHPRVLIVNGQLGNALHGSVWPSLNVGLPACALQTCFSHPQFPCSFCYGVLSQHCQHNGQSENLQTDN